MANLQGNEIEVEVVPQFIEPHPRVDAIRNSVAIQRGPVVYCLEQIDCQANLMVVRVDPNRSMQATWQDELLPEGIVTVEVEGCEIDAGEWHDQLYRPHTEDQHASSATSARLRAIPYYAWANRGVQAMRVWIPRTSSS